MSNPSNPSKKNTGSDSEPAQETQNDEDTPPGGVPGVSQEDSETQRKESSEGKCGRVFLRVRPSRDDVETETVLSHVRRLHQLTLLEKKSTLGRHPLGACSEHELQVLQRAAGVRVLACLTGDGSIEYLFGVNSRGSLVGLSVFSRGCSRIPTNSSESRNHKPTPGGPRAWNHPRNTTRKIPRRILRRGLLREA